MSSWRATSAGLVWSARRPTWYLPTYLGTHVAQRCSLTFPLPAVYLSSPSRLGQVPWAWNRMGAHWRTSRQDLCGSPDFLESARPASLAWGRAALGKNREEWSCTDGIWLGGSNPWCTIWAAIRDKTALLRPRHGSIPSSPIHCGGDRRRRGTWEAPGYNSRLSPDRHRRHGSQPQHPIFPPYYFLRLPVLRMTAMWAEHAQT